MLCAGLGSCFLRLFDGVLVARVAGVACHQTNMNGRSGAHQDTEHCQREAIQQSRIINCLSMCRGGDNGYGGNPGGTAEFPNILMYVD